VVKRFEGPLLTIYGAKDVVAPHGFKQFVDEVPGAAGQAHAILEGGGHFLQEDVGPEYTQALLTFLEATR